MSTTPQPPAPSKWAMEAAREYYVAIHGEKTAALYANADGQSLLSAIIQRHHAAAQAETVALLEEAANDLEVVTRALRQIKDLANINDAVRVALINCGNSLNANAAHIRTHLAQLKEGAP